MTPALQFDESFAWGSRSGANLCIAAQAKGETRFLAK
jgi:hypothetical protein